MKKLIFVLLLFISINGYCAEQPDLSELEKNSGGFNISGIVSDITNGNFVLDIKEIINNTLDLILQQFRLNFSLLVSIVVAALFSAVCENILTSFKSGNYNVYLVFFSVISLFGLNIFTKCLNETQVTLDNLLMFVNALYPIILNSLATGGRVTTAATLHPVLMVCGSMIMMLIKTFIIPMISVSMAIQLSDALSYDIRTSKLSLFINKTIKWFVGIVMTLFIGVVSATGCASGVYDSVTVRAAKYAIGSFIPVVGGVISDSFDLVLSGSGIIKSSVGIAGLINILFLCLLPCIKLLTVAISFSICSAIVQPVCNKRITEIISIFGNGIFTLFGMICASACMFILCTGVLISLR